RLRRRPGMPLSLLAPGGLPERPMGADCKSVAKATEVRILDPPRTGLEAPPPGETRVTGPSYWSHSVPLGTARPHPPDSDSGSSYSTNQAATATRMPLGPHHLMLTVVRAVDVCSILCDRSPAGLPFPA